MALFIYFYYIYLIGLLGLRCQSPGFVGFQLRIPDGEVVEVFLRLRRDDAGQAQEGNEVRDSHEAVHDIRQGPDGFQFEENGGCQDDDVADTVKLSLPIVMLPFAAVKLPLFTVPSTMRYS